jgi:AraC-like DNA-binding protein
VFFVNVTLVGSSRLRQFGREVTVPAGGLLLIDSSEPYLLEQSGPIQLASLAVPAAALQRASNDVRKWVARPMAQTAAASLLAAQVQALARWPHAIAPQEAGVIADVMQGLLPAVFGDAEPGAGTGRYLVRRVRTLIAERYAEPSLSPRDVAGIAGVSLRSLHAALAREGTTFATELTAHRLERARAMLHSPLCHDSVKAVALRCGYVSPAHFARSFRARFGVTPGACRPH